MAEVADNTAKTESPAEQISGAASDVIQPGEMIWVVVGDRQKIESGIRELEIGDISVLDADGRPLSP